MKTAAVRALAVMLLFAGAYVGARAASNVSGFPSTMAALTAIYNLLAQAVGQPGDIGSDVSANPGSLSGLNLLGTLAANPSRLGYVVEVQDTAADCGGNGLAVAFDDGAGNDLTVLYLGYAAARGAQGGSASWDGMPHSGRIRYYGTSGCQVGAHEW